MKLIQQVKRRMGTGSSSSSTSDDKKASKNNKTSAPAAPVKAHLNNVGNVMENGNGVLPKLNEVPITDRTALFQKKIRACTLVYDFNKDGEQKEKEAKRNTLLEMVEYVNNTRNAFNESLMQDVVNMVASNIFRSLPKRDDFANDDPEEEPNLEKAWPHLQFVYEFFLRFVVSNDVDPKVAKKFVDQTFMLKWLELFDSDDPRERDYLKTVLHRVYGKFMSLRSFIRRGIQHTFFKVIYESEVHNGVSELLEILGSIISGFALPLKEEHKDFLTMALIPLHKVKTLAAFHQQLSYCMGQYVDKDPALAFDVIASMLRFWPVATTQKQVVFLNMLEETLELTHPPEFLKLQEMLFRRISLCISSPQFQVAERTLFFWNNDYLVKLINQNRQAIFPVIIGPLYTNSQKHWNIAVHGLSFSVLKLLMDADPQLFEQCDAKQREDGAQDESRKEARESKWEKLREVYTKQHGKLPDTGRL